MGYYKATSEKMREARGTARTELERGYAQYASNRQAQVAAILKLQADAEALREKAAGYRMGVEDPSKGYVKESTSYSRTEKGSKPKTEPKYTGLTKAQQTELKGLVSTAIGDPGAQGAVIEFVRNAMVPPEVDKIEAWDHVLNAIQLGISDFTPVEGGPVQKAPEGSKKAIARMVSGALDWGTLAPNLNTEDVKVATQMGQSLTNMRPKPDQTQVSQGSSRSGSKTTVRATREKQAELDRRATTEFKEVIRAYSDDGSISPAEEAAFAERTGSEKTLQQYADEFMEDTFLQRIKYAGTLDEQARVKEESAAAQQAAYDAADVIGAPTEEQVAYRALQLYNPRGSLGYPERRKGGERQPREATEGPAPTGALQKAMENMTDGQRRQMGALFGAARGRRAAKVAGLSEADATRMVDQLEVSGLQGDELITALNDLASDYTYGDDKKARLVSDYLLSLKTDRDFKRELSQAQPAPAKPKEEEQEELFMERIVPQDLSFVEDLPKIREYAERVGAAEAERQAQVAERQAAEAKAQERRARATRREQPVEAVETVEEVVVGEPATVPLEASVPEVQPVEAPRSQLQQQALGVIQTFDSIVKMPQYQQNPEQFKDLTRQLGDSARDLLNQGIEDQRLKEISRFGFQGINVSTPDEARPDPIPVMEDVQGFMGELLTPRPDRYGSNPGVKFSAPYRGSVRELRDNLNQQLDNADLIQSNRIASKFYEAAILNLNKPLGPRDKQALADVLETTEAILGISKENALSERDRTFARLSAE